MSYAMPFEPHERDDPGIRALHKCLQQRREKKKPFDSLASIGRALGVSKQGVAQWDQIPAHHVIAIEALVGLSRYRQRPDIYPPITHERRKGKKRAR
jgi:hypothetical protein